MSWTKDGGLDPRIAETTRGIFIGGDWRETRGEHAIDVVDPSTGGTVAALTAAGGGEVDAAVAAARRAFDDGGWGRTGGAERARLILRLADIIETHADELALLEAIDGGKPLRMARMVDVGGSIERLRYAAGAATRMNGEAIRPVSAPNALAYTIHEPVGVAGLIVAWNFPLMMAVSKMSDALAAGCTVVVKPSENTSLSTLRLAELAREAGFPDGVINVVTGLGGVVGQALAEHPGVDKISFTGSTAVGKRLIAASAGNLKRLTLELGGKSPAFVFADADMDVAITGVFRNIYYNSGQVCAAGSRVYAHRSVYDRLVAGLVAKAEALRVGPALAEGTEMGPLVSQAHFDRVANYADGARAAGATVLTGGSRIDRPGFFMQPTILADTDAAMAVRREEIFGPVLCVTPFDDDDLEALAREANATEYGLSAYIYTTNLNTAHRMARLIRAGLVRINAGALDMAVPFGGYKQSGWGRENGTPGWQAYTELKSVVVPL